MSALRVLLVGDVPPGLAAAIEDAGGSVERANALDDVGRRLDELGSIHAVVLDDDVGSDDADRDDAVEAIAGRVALLVTMRAADDEAALAWLGNGVQDVLVADECAGSAGLRRLRHAVERQRLAFAADAHASDPATGLPHRRQLVLHLSQLLALREREPSPMALLVLRVDAGPSAERAPLLRRKVAVRLRAGLRVSDVVASIDRDVYAVLLGSILVAGDAERVAAKLVASLLAPFSVGGEPVRIGVAAGIAQHPGDGKDAERLLRRAEALAVAAPMVGAERGGGQDAANDD